MAPIPVPNVYSLIYESSNIADTANTWRNTFDIYSPAVFDSADPVVDIFGTLILESLHPNDQIVKATCYNKVFGAQPYPAGTPIFTKDYNNPGTANLHWYPPLVATYSELGKEVCARIDHIAVTGGKPGRTFLRRFFGSPDAAGGDAGPWFIVNGPASVYDTKLQAIITAIGLDAYLAAGSNVKKLVVVRHSKRVGAPPPSFVQVSALKFVDVTTNRTTRKNRH